MFDGLFGSTFQNTLKATLQVVEAITSAWFNYTGANDLPEANVDTPSTNGNINFAIDSVDSNRVIITFERTGINVATAKLIRVTDEPDYNDSITGSTIQLFGTSSTVTAVANATSTRSMVAAINSGTDIDVRVVSHSGTGVGGFATSGNIGNVVSTTIDPELQMTALSDTKFLINYAPNPPGKGTVTHVTRSDVTVTVDSSLDWVTGMGVPKAMNIAAVSSSLAIIVWSDGRGNAKLISSVGTTPSLLFSGQINSDLVSNTVRFAIAKYAENKAYYAYKTTSNVIKITTLDASSGSTITSTTPYTILTLDISELAISVPQEGVVLVHILQNAVAIRTFVLEHDGNGNFTYKTDVAAETGNFEYLAGTAMRSDVAVLTYNDLGNVPKVGQYKVLIN